MPHNAPEDIVQPFIRGWGSIESFGELNLTPNKYTVISNPVTVPHSLITRGKFSNILDVGRLLPY